MGPRQRGHVGVDRRSRGVDRGRGHGQSLDDSTAEEQATPTADLGDGISYGLGVMRVGSWVGHTGSALGWQSLLLHDTESAVTLVVAASTCGDASDVLWDVAYALYPEAL